jgi:hypothetical protein
LHEAAAQRDDQKIRNFPGNGHHSAEKPSNISGMNWELLATHPRTARTSPKCRHHGGDSLLCRSSVTICSGVGLLFGMSKLLSKPISINSLGTKRAGQVTITPSSLPH